MDQRFQQLSSGEMIMRSPEQSERIAFEEQIVPIYFPGAQFRDSPTGTNVDFRTGRNGRRYDYLPRVELSLKYPHEEPGLFIQSPRILPMFQGDGVLNYRKTSHTWHIHENKNDDRVKVCYTWGWDASMNCVLVLLRAVIWIDAYENHLNTGETIAEYIDRLKDEIGGW
jgi:hypothetical protein